MDRSHKSEASSNAASLSEASETLSALLLLIELKDESQRARSPYLSLALLVYVYYYVGIFIRNSRSLQMNT